MITPRRTRLLRFPDLAAFRTSLTNSIGGVTPRTASATFVLVPTRAAAEQLRRTAEDRLLAHDRTLLVLPAIGTREELYDGLAARLSPAPRVLSAFEREAMLAAIARQLAADGIAPPFEIRPGLIAEMLALYDLVRRLGRSVDYFERNFTSELEKDREIDRGAEQLLQQTVFLTAAFRAYEARLTAIDAVDEHGLRDRLIASPSANPIASIIITVADRVADPDGLWPADFELLTRLPRLESVDVLATEPMLSAGLLERLHALLPELEEERDELGVAAGPTLITPAPATNGGAATVVFSYRDREEELAAVARRLKTERPALDRCALVVRRPLPYLYLARDVFASAGVPFEALDTLPLAAEPYAAAVDLVLDGVAADFTRRSVVALLRSPHFRIGTEDAVDAVSVAALDVALAEARFLGGLDRMVQLATQWSHLGAPASREERRQKTAAPAALAAAAALQEIAPLAAERPLIDQVATLVDWLQRFDREPAVDDPIAARRLRVRGAVLAALTALADAVRAHDVDAVGDVTVLTAAIRRWLGAQTFAVSTGDAGLQLVDAQAARFGEFDDVQLLGLIDGEWPDRARRNVLYPSSLLAHLEPLPINPDPARREREALNAARAAFTDLLRLGRRRVRVSTFVLEHDAIVEPSMLIDDVSSVFARREVISDASVRVFASEALSLEPRVADSLPASIRAWAEARFDACGNDPARFRGEAGAWALPRVSVSRLERYLDCPFRFFASEVLRLEEQPEDEDTRTPLERGRFLHELFERFFAAWQQRGHRRITAALLPDARALFATFCEEALAALSPAEAALERTRLLGSAVSPGIAHRVFAMEAERPIEVVERLLEFPLQGDFVFHTSEGEERTVRLSAKTDRIDLLADGTLRVIDYKSKKTPDVRIALQLPVYSYCAMTSLNAGPRTWKLGEALYVSFEGPKAVVPLRAKGRDLDQLIDDAQDRLVRTLDRIAEGRFPATPQKRAMCGLCPYSAVCRLEYVEEEAHEAGEHG